MKNIIIAEFKHETSSLTTQLTDVNAFKARTYLTGEEITKYFSGVKSEVGGFLTVFADKPDFRLIPAIALNATPGGPVTMDVFHMARNAILNTIRETDRVDGVLLSLHGAMVLTECDDGEGELLESIRAAVGTETPIMATLDLHANLTQRMADHADALFVYDYYPHTDAYQTGVDAANCMYMTLTGKAKPTMRCRKLPLLLPYMPTDLPQMKKFVDKEHAYERETGVLGVNICHGFFSADMSEQGVAVIAITDNDAKRAVSIADTLGEEIWEDRKKLVRELYSIDEAIDEVLSSERQPFVIADVSDNPGAGSPSDSTHILKRLLERNVKNVAVATIVDPESVEQAEQAGVGNRFHVLLGGKSYPDIVGEPIEAEAYVKMIMDGEYKNRDEVQQGVLNHMGKTAVLTIDGIDVIVATNRVQPWDLEAYRACGIMPQDKKILVTKSKVHYRNSYGKVAYACIDVEVPGISPESPQAIASHHKLCKRPIYPLDDI